jgi:toxin YoeB
MDLGFTPQGWADYLYWQTADKAVLRRVNRLIGDALRQPREGLGKPEPLKYQLGDVWSRRITEEHRLVYELAGGQLLVLQARFHYDD